MYKRKQASYIYRLLPVASSCFPPCQSYSSPLNISGIMAEILLKSSCPQAGCLAEADLAHRVFLPADTDYISRNKSYWSQHAQLRPACIVTPRSAEEVAKAVVALKAGGHAFASKSESPMTRNPVYYLRLSNRPRDVWLSFPLSPLRPMIFSAAAILYLP